MRYEHGGDVYRAAREMGLLPEDILDLSANVADTMSGILSGIDLPQAVSRLPEPYSRTLCHAYAQHIGVHPDMIVAGSGTSELLAALCRVYSGSRGGVIHPTYSGYEEAMTMAGMIPVPFILGADYAVTASLLRNHPCDVLFLCNPNNPTGTAFPKEGITEVASLCPDTLFVIDESYLPLDPQGDSYTLLPVLPANVCVLRSFSKVFGVPGMRIGFLLCGNRVIAEQVSEQLSPWSVSSLAQVAAMRMVRCDTSPVADIYRTRAEMMETILSRINGMTVYRSRVNYFIVQLSGISASTMQKEALKERMLIRSCASFPGLGEQFIRISARDGAERFCTFARRLLGGTE